MPPCIVQSWKKAIRRDAGGGSVVASTLLILTCLVLGLLAGGMLVIGVALVRFWQSLAPSDFQAWFAAHAHLVGRLMIPLGVGAMAIQNALIRLALPGSPSTAVMTTNTTQLAVDLAIVLRRGDNPDQLARDQRGAVNRRDGALLGER